MAYKDPRDPRAREARLRHYESNKTQYTDRVKEARKRNKEYTDHAKNRPCADCNLSYPPYVMHFDHVGNDKDRDVGKLARAGVSLARLQKEIDKCEVVCANCHSERTFQRRSRE